MPSIILELLPKRLFDLAICVEVLEHLSLSAAKKIIDYISDYTSLHKNLLKVFYLEKFPLNKNNKINYNSKLFKLLDR